MVLPPSIFSATLSSTSGGIESILTINSGADVEYSLTSLPKLSIALT